MSEVIHLRAIDRVEGEYRYQRLALELAARDRQAHEHARSECRLLEQIEELQVRATRPRVTFACVLQSSIPVGLE